MIGASCIFRSSLSEYGFRKDGFRKGIKSVAIILFIWLFVQGIVGIVFILTNISKPGFNYPLTYKNYLGNLGFQILLSGTSEEILYRAFPIPIMMLLGKHLKMKTSHSNFLAIGTTILFFLVGHIGYTLVPFRIVYYSIYQLLTVFIFGVFYGVLFIKYKNVYLVMILHGMLNAIIALLALGFWKFF